MANYYNTHPPPNSQGSSNQGPYNTQGSNNFFSSQPAPSNNASYYGQSAQQQAAPQQQPPQQSIPPNRTPSTFQPTNPTSNAPPKPTMPNLFNPANAATAAALLSGNQDALFQVGQNFIGKVPGQMQPGVGRFMGALRVYFAVDNHYVKSKMQRILFPFVFKKWVRTVRSVTLCVLMF